MKAKEFDCIRMKDGIQTKLLRREKGLTDAEVRNQIKRKLETSDSSVARLWRMLWLKMKAA